MLEQRVKLYLSKTIELAKSITFKSVDIAEAMNRGLVELGYEVDPTDPTSWKYYLNLAGQYHETNAPMSVVSLDTLETIEFTTQNLQWHRSTRDAYRYGTRFYHELVRQYPGQEILIHAVVNPIDIDTAIEAPDGTILNYDASLVDPNETDLIPRIQEWIQGFVHRWNTEAYGLVDDLYAASMIGVLYSQLPATILSIRQSNVHTSRAHGFHIRERLASYQRLDEFYELMTLDQRLFLYRNLDYLRINAGNQKTYEMLVENLLTRRGISLVEYDLKHDHTEVPDISLEPTVFVRGENVNFRERSVTGRVESVVDQVGKLNGLALGNPDALEDDVAYIETKGPRAMLTQLPTKTLEARAVDPSATYEVSLEEMLLNHWLYLSATGRYNATVPVTNPVTGLAQSLTSKEAWVVYFYCWLRGQNVTLETIPTFLASTVQRPTLPTVDQMEVWFGSDDPRLVLMRDRLQPYTTYQQPIGFNETVSQIHQAFLDNTWLYKAEHEAGPNGRLRLIHQRCYQDVDVDLYTGEQYRDWLLDRGVVVEDFNRFDFIIFADEILRRFTGLDLSESESIRRVLNAMVKIMGRLSSYHVQYIPYLENDNYYNVPWVIDRLDDTGYHAYQHEFVDDGPYRPKSSTLVYSHSDVATVVPLNWTSLTARATIAIDTRVRMLAPAKVYSERSVEQAYQYFEVQAITPR